MILIADSGSTKTDWRLVENGAAREQFRTQGMNPYFQSEEEMRQELTEHLLPCLKDFEIGNVFFYGAGCAFPERNETVRNAIFKSIGSHSEIYSDLLGAARSLCGHRSGIACILGTGSNSCYYDGERIIHTVSPLGFILGDEGSGAFLGKILVGDCLKNQLSLDLKEAFFKETGLTAEIILERVYRHSFPNRFLAGLVPFIARHIDQPEMYRLVKRAFEVFFVRNVLQYDVKDEKVHCVGSIAWYFRDILTEAARELNIQTGTICQSPLEGLIQYHS